MDFVLLLEYTESLLKQPVDRLFMDKSMVVSNSAWRVDACRLSAVVDDLDFLRLPSDALLLPSKPPKARYFASVSVSYSEMCEFGEFTLLLSFNASIIALPLTLFNVDVANEWLFVKCVSFLLELLLIVEDLRLNMISSAKKK